MDYVDRTPDAIGLSGPPIHMLCSTVVIVMMYISMQRTTQTTTIAIGTLGIGNIVMLSIPKVNNLG